MNYLNTHIKSGDVKLAFLAFIVCLLISFSKDEGGLLTAAITAIP